MAEQIGEGTHEFEPHHAAIGDRLNWLRAGVLGANDGLISTAGIVIGVAAATGESSAILTAGIAGLTAGAVSMALGEYVSVSTQRDTEVALIAKEKAELTEMPDDEFAELEQIYRQKGLSSTTARLVAEELTANDALQAHLDAELGIDEENLTSPVAAALSSAVSFSVGASIPILASLIHGPRILAIVLAVLVGLALTGYISARLGDADVRRATARVVIGGLIAMAVTYAVGRLLGTTGIA
ncbi:VIT1/CCC1 transporter family protein [Tsukamurella ocularis]|uniref:VIT1/CCC1 transporter family protein n=1 Tax=Tsukamurella ocularis TaxID=1970234 RepID=UPI0021686CCE|nr:VIT family protein [Tsukamurella ocularis]MCS3779703.1 VIT1/CCC1 family predicted Fe2+/Mn2+ transporter [Tsukamurella ocularis]MCS3788897.1 VIT1/CCC1 family predicted Fe2+/Mn2+ transporter [Tsukamurella ocularis]MCS3850107.1 VIT1/CCC1 family predicted Fe2+/Mn2+ transporter [Tsukamurella ocularis]